MSGAADLAELPPQVRFQELGRLVPMTGMGVQEPDSAGSLACAGLTADLSVPASSHTT